MSQALIEEIIAEIDQSPGQAIPFSRYMELALYHPRWGYYQTDRIKLGKEGDFFTNAHVGSMMGQLLGRLFAHWTARWGKEAEWVLVEIGAGDGRLMEQVIKEWLAQGGTLDKLKGYLVETSPFHQQLQRDRLAPFSLSLQWVERLEQIPPSTYAFVYSNELVDAFPVDRIKKEGGALWKAYVIKGMDGGLQDDWRPLNCKDDVELWDQAQHLSEGQQAEVSVRVHRWLEQVASWMESGVLLTIDYGGERDELLMRPHGTLRAYHQHQLLTDLYQMPGEMDLTAYVDFTALRRWGEQGGFRTLAYQTQAEFCLHAGILDLLPRTLSPDPFSPEAKRMRAINQLIHPQAMGESFRVLLQAKGLDAMIEKQLFPNLSKQKEDGR